MATVQDKMHAYNGGMIVEKHAGSFIGQDQITGQPKEVTWTDHIQIVTAGEKGVIKSKLSGSMVIALCQTFEEDEGFREWCSKCL